MKVGDMARSRLMEVSGIIIEIVYGGVHLKLLKSWKLSAYHVPVTQIWCDCTDIEVISEG